MPKHSVAGLQSRDLDLAICRPYLFCRDSRGVRFLPSSNRVHMQRRANHTSPNIGATSQSIDRGFDLCCDSWIVNHTELARGGLVALIIGASYVIEAVRSRIGLIRPTPGVHWGLSTAFFVLLVYCTCVRRTIAKLQGTPAGCTW
jgi:hypothetical protein